MLASLSIKNYALIDDICISFRNGFIIITGETGAGKSIILGALSLVLGKRADLGVLKDNTKKCIIEAAFAIREYHVTDFFETHQIDYDEVTIIRREILPGGKSRAFINDTPVTLNILSFLTEKLIDIHAQHQTFQLIDDDFQWSMVDAVAENTEVLENYRSTLRVYHQTKKALQKEIEAQKAAEKEHEYNSFLWKELHEANLKEGMLEMLEATSEKLNNTEDIGEKLAHALQLLTNEQQGILAMLSELKLVLHKLSSYGMPFTELQERIVSAAIELDDTAAVAIQFQETLDTDPRQLEEVNTRLQQIHQLQQKHNVLTVKALLEKQSELEEIIAHTENLETEIKNKQLNILKLEKTLDAFAATLHKNRKQAIPKLITHIEKRLSAMGLEKAKLQVKLQRSPLYLSYGKDTLEFLFSANKGGDFAPLSKVASGGELSRIMLAVKSVLATYIKLPTMILDEIDAGISGETAHKVGEIMQQMSKTMQVITITHLPQIAAKGDTHFKVYKKEVVNDTRTEIKELGKEDRINEIAEMLGGKNNFESALIHAKSLLSS